MQAKNTQSSDPSRPIGAEDLDRLLNLLRRALSNVAHADDQALKKDGDGKAKIDLLEHRVSALDQELLSLTDAIRRLGDAVVITACTGRIRDHLNNLKSFFRDNLRQLNQKNERLLGHDYRVKQLPNGLDGLADELKRFKYYFDESGEFGDKSIGECLETLEDHLRHWSYSLRVDFKGRLNDPEVRKYINHLATEVAGHLARLTGALKRYREVEVPTIQVAQEHQVSAFQNLSAVAAFFAGVNATAIQYSLNLTDTLLARWTNLLWILSLVLSITSAISSQISNHWRPAGHRTAQPHVPTIVSLWMTHIPLLLLGLSVFIFSSGLICFAFQVFGHHFFIPLLTLIVTSFMMFALIMVGLWIAWERFVGIQGNSRQWLAAIIFRSFKRTVRCLSSRCAQFVTFWNSVQISRRLGSFLRSIARIFRPNTSPPPPLLPLSSCSGMMAPAKDQVVTPKLVRTPCTTDSRSPQIEMTTAERLAYTGPIARGLQMKLALPSFVRSPQFSPDGRFLAGFDEDHLTIYKVDPSFLVYKRFPIASSKLTTISWSHPGSGNILAYFGCSIELWDVEGGEHRIIERPDWIDFAKWLPRRRVIVSLESGSIHIVDTSNDVTKLALDRFRTQSLEITSDEKWLIAVATVESPGLGGWWNDWRIIVYDLETNTITRQIPMLSEPSYISLSEDDEYALINFNDGTPPRLYSLGCTFGLLKFERQFELDDGSPLQSIWSVFGQIEGPDGRQHHVIMSINRGKADRIIIWDLQTGTRFNSFPWSSGSVPRILDVTWNPRPPPGSALMLAVEVVEDEEVGGCVAIILHSPFPSPEDQQSIGVGGNVPDHESAIDSESETPETISDQFTPG